MFKDVVKGIAKNTSVLVFQQIVTWISTFLLMLFVPRYLGPVEYGHLYLANSIIDVFRIIVWWGANSLVVKLVSRSPESTGQIIADSSGVRLLLGVAAFACTMLLAEVLNYSMEMRILLFIMGSALVWTGALDVLKASYQAHELMQYSSIGTVSQQVLTSALCIGALLMGGRTKTVALMGVIANLSNFLLLMHYRHTITAQIPRIKWANAFRHLREGIPYLLMAVFSTIYYRIDAFMISQMTPEVVVGWYGGAYRLFDVLSFFPYIFGTALYPALSRLWASEERVHKITTHKSIEFMILGSIPIGITVVLFSDKLIQLFYGVTGYEQSIPVYQILIAGLPLLYVDFVLATTLVSSDKQRALSLVSLGAIPVNILLNLVTIPYFQREFSNGGLGAAIATVVTEMGIMVAFLSLMPKGLLTGFRTEVIAKSLGGGVLMGGAIWGLHVVGIPWLLVAILGPILYLILLSVMRTFEPDEVKLLRRLLSPRGISELLRFVKPGSKLS